MPRYGCLVSRECASGRNCVAVSLELPAGSDCPLCPGCVARASADIAALRGDYADLAAELGRAGAAPGPYVSGGDVEAPVPLALSVEALQRDIVWTLTTWEAPVREAAGLPPRREAPVRDVWAVVQASRLLADRVALLAGLDPVWGYADGLDAGPVERDGLYGVDQLRRLHVRALGTLGASLTTRRLPGRCPRCGAELLVRDDGADVVRCEGCALRWPLVEYRHRVSLILAAGTVSGPLTL